MSFNDWLFQPALDALPTAIVIADSDGAIVLVNRQVESMLGYAPKELVGHSINMLLPEVWPPDSASHVDLGTTLEGRLASTDRVLGARHHDGSTSLVTVDVSRVITPDGVFVLVALAEARERHATEGAQREGLAASLAFERFVADLSFQFVNAPDDQVEDAIRGGLQRVSTQLAIDRSSFFRVDDSGTLFESHSWTALGFASDHWPLAAHQHFPWTMERVLGNHTVVFATLDEVPHETDRASFRVLGTKSAVYIPLSVDGRVTGAVGFSMLSDERPWPVDVLRRLDLVASVFNQMLARQQRHLALQIATREMARLKDRLQAENVYLRREERDQLSETRVVGESAAVRRVMEQISHVAPTDSTVLLLGETGTGKELFATLIHELSARRARPMVRVNCAALPTTLIESELFGRERGAFTGALSRQVGRFELADHSTIFLDEIGDLPVEVQVKLLRVLEERTIERLGSPRRIDVNTRIIAATHRDLERLVAAGTFREDLYYRLNVFPIHVPPLREREGDITLLVWRFVEEFSRAFGKRVDSIDRDSLTTLQQYSWPGNIRELRNLVERAMIATPGGRLTIPAPQSAPVASARSARLLDVEKEHIRSILESTGWRIRGTAGAAERLGMKPTTLETRIAKLGLRRPTRS